MNILFRVDASLSIGTGHVIRCLNLAKKLASTGEKCIFFTKNHKGNIIQRIKDSHFDTAIIESSLNQNKEYIEDEKAWLGSSQEEDASQCIKLIIERSVKPDIIIIDHYSLDIVWEKIILQQFPQITIVVIDDLCNRKHLCHLLIDQTIERTVSEYAKFVPNYCHCLVGTCYALLNETFHSLRPIALVNRNRITHPRSVLITMGGVDAHNITSSILQYLENINDCNIDIVTIVLGENAPHIEKVKKQASTSNLKKIDVLVNVNNMAELMLKHDMAIGAMGGTTWERCVMALPAINLCIADNQKNIARILTQMGLFVLDSKEMDESSFKLVWNDFIYSYKQQKELVSNVCDGNGLMRVAQHILSMKNKQKLAIHLRMANEQDIQYVYQLQSEPQTRRYARNPNIPKWEEHVQWMKKKLNDKESFFYLIESDNREPCGVVRLDKITHPLAQYEVSIFVTSLQQGRGVASSAIKKILKTHPTLTILATVLPENIASHNLFRHLGFKSISPDEYIFESN